METTNSVEYADYLIQHHKKFKTKLLQIPYRMHLRYLRLGKVLDIGCGAGRNLVACDRGSVGLDHNPLLVKACVEQGCEAYDSTGWELKKSDLLNSFDSILLSHVIEHMTQTQAIALISEYLPYLKPFGRVVIICPQEAGYKTDKTHVEYFDFQKTAEVLKRLNLKIINQYSFPFNRKAGNYLPFNEFVSVGQRSV